MLDDRDRRILALLQENGEMPAADIAELLSLSASACSRRIARLRADGYITGTMALLDRKKINLPTTIFLLVKTGRHSKDWLDQFHAAVTTIPEIVEVHRLTGNFDYILKLVLPNVEYYDTVYKQLLKRMEMYDMSAYISMETVKLSAGLPTKHI
ncbi:Lrp/AsnC family transcriptional regulator [Hyphomonas sp. WL0036]|uniref:Lrp/AsnC family transcriptional regulator n=1 Tax=Hyphomonas sediminis TaxID=2866160 RepID=UPI001C814E60|nr:Lrp/AsnC family transcriptional regulator [Hyphomonas sediminis]MBY9068122.1 Lrp/AsnC family transcriptional regulator [Hyphomonas sediminis]